MKFASGAACNCPNDCEKVDYRPEISLAARAGLDGPNSVVSRMRNKKFLTKYRVMEPTNKAKERVGVAMDSLTVVLAGIKLPNVKSQICILCRRVAGQSLLQEDRHREV